MDKRPVFYYDCFSRSMDLLDIVREKVEPGYIDCHRDEEETRVQKRMKIFSLQAQKGVLEMQVESSYILEEAHFAKADLIIEGYQWQNLSGLLGLCSWKIV